MLKPSQVLIELIDSLQTKLDCEDIKRYMIIITFDHFWVGFWGNNVARNLDEYSKRYKVIKYYEKK